MELCCFQALNYQGINYSIRDNWTLRFLPANFELFIPGNQQTIRGLTVQTGLPDLDYPGEIGLLLPNGNKGRMSEIINDIFKALKENN